MRGILLKRFHIYKLNTHDSVSCGRREEGILVIDKEEVGLVLVEGVGKVVRLWAHDVIWQTERMREPLQRDIMSMGDITQFEGNFNL